MVIYKVERANYYICDDFKMKKIFGVLVYFSAFTHKAMKYFRVQTMESKGF